MAELVQEGKVRYLGLSEAAPADDPPRARRPSDLGAADRVLALDPRSRGRDPADRPRARHRLRRLQPARPRLPLRAGSARSTTSRATTSAGTGRASRSENLAQNLALVAEVEALAAEKGVTPSQLALAWVLARGDDIVPIPGTKRRSLSGGERGGGRRRADRGRSGAARARLPAGRRGGRPLSGHVDRQPLATRSANAKPSRSTCSPTRHGISQSKHGPA